ncbi:hypothetical protein F4695_004520 [Rhizobium soli]|uniref:Uncharacterized protein n=1 Tax=Rhizobium soli TaxID=424798 RepID=A0A7X0JQL2_9HYPH|nr:hypothetical protein [Rhizobium soli]
MSLADEEWLVAACYEPGAVLSETARSARIRVSQPKGFPGLSLMVQEA